MSAALSGPQANLLGILAGSATGLVEPQGGGYWAVDGARISESTHTVQALERRGYLEKVGSGPPWRSAFRLTEAGRAVEK